MLNVEWDEDRFFAFIQHSTFNIPPLHSPMPKPLAAVISQIAEGKIPPVILVGGSSDYLAEDAFRDLRDAIVAARPGLAVEGYEAGSELAAILDSYRTMSLFGSGRLILISEVNAFVSAK